MDGIWQNGQFVLASTLEDRDRRLTDENIELRRLLMVVASLLYETEGITRKAADSLTKVITDTYRNLP